mmetsp:Transcript_24707/g.30385  ORF Transcript_24707/g.30385 Transcript_24707/m.30385 type:complete len:192 (-) Transcript_24707:97-672(-)
MLSKSVLKSRAAIRRLSGTGLRRAVGPAATTEGASDFAYSTALNVPPSFNTIENTMSMLFDDNNTVRKLNDEILSQRLNDFEKLINEARLIIQDCIELDESDEDGLADDKETAKDAVREAVSVFSDLIDDLTHEEKDNNDIEKRSQAIQMLHGSQLEDLKNELKLVLEENQRSNILLFLESIRDKIAIWKP